MEEEKVKIVYKNKKTPGKTVAIVFLTIMVLLLASYIGYTKYQEITMEEEKEVENIVEEELTYSEVMDLLSKIEDYNENFSKYYPISDFRKLDNQEKLNFGIYMLTKYENTHNYYKIEDMKTVYKENFSDNLKVLYEDISCRNKDGVLYSLSNGTYTLDNTHEHGTESIDIDTFYVESSKLDDIYQITVHILYSNYCTGICPNTTACYSTYQDAVSSTNKVLDSKKEYSDYKNTLKKTTFTFVKKYDSYLLKSVK